MQPRPNRYLLLWLLALLNVLNQVDRNLIAGFALQITDDLSLSNAEFGLLSGLLFAGFYSVAGLFMGVLADRVHRGRLIAAGVAVWSLVTAATGAARSFGEMAMARVLVSVGEASLTPAATSLLTTRFDAAARGTAIGIFFMGIPLGLGASFLLAGLLGPLLGWRGTFVLLGFLGLVLVLAVLRVQDPERTGNRGERGEPAESIRATISQLLLTLRTTPMLRYTVAGIVTIHCFYAGQGFAQLWLVKELQFEWSHIVTVYGAAAMVAGTLGSLLGGVLSDWYQARCNGSRSGFIVWVILACAPLMLAYRLSEPGSVLFYLGMGSGFFLVMASYGPAFATLQENTPERLRGSVVGATMLAINVVAIGLGALLVGLAADAMQAQGIRLALTYTLLGCDLIALSSMAWFGLVAWQLRRRKPAAKPAYDGPLP